MNLNFTRQTGNLEQNIRGCSESERLRIFRQMCYEKRMFEHDETVIENKALFDRVGRIFARMGYRDRF